LGIGNQLWPFLTASHNLKLPQFVSVPP